MCKKAHIRTALLCEKLKLNRLNSSLETVKEEIFDNFLLKLIKHSDDGFGLHTCNILHHSNISLHNLYDIHKYVIK